MAAPTPPVAAATVPPVGAILEIAAASATDEISICDGEFAVVELTMKCVNPVTGNAPHVHRYRGIIVDFSSASDEWSWEIMLPIRQW